MTGQEALSVVARKLVELGIADAVFVGGSVVEFYITDRAADTPRHTVDIDVVVPVTTRGSFHEIEEKLLAHGYHQPAGGPICRWEIEGILVDLMPPDVSVLGFTNRWYAGLGERAFARELGDGTLILLPSPPHFIATKLEAFRGRGNDDAVRSPDIEDIIVVLDGRPELVDEILHSDAKVRTYVQDEFANLLAYPDLDRVVEANLRPDPISQRRATIIMDRMRAVARG